MLEFSLSAGINRKLTHGIADIILDIQGGNISLSKPIDSRNIQLKGIFMEWRPAFFGHFFHFNEPITTAGHAIVHKNDLIILVQLYPTFGKHLSRDPLIITVKRQTVAIIASHHHGLKVRLQDMGALDHLVLCNNPVTGLTLKRISQQSEGKQYQGG